MALLFSFFFFFKQKTAYEMRISDWSSDVCSSDLRRRRSQAHLVALIQEPRVPRRAGHKRRAGFAIAREGPCRRGRLHCQLTVARDRQARATRHNPRRLFLVRPSPAHRSEEHTSELQSLIRISYAVFCLKKKTKYTQH